MTESQESERRQREFAERTALFQEALDVDEVIAQLLVTEGFATVEDVAYVDAVRNRRHRGLRRGHRRGNPGPRPRLPGQGSRRVSTPSASSWASRTACWSSGRHPADGRGPGRRRREDASRTWPAWPPTTCAAGSRARTASGCKVPGVLESFNLAAGDAELLIMRARVAMGWIEASERRSPSRSPRTRTTPKANTTPKPSSQTAPSESRSKAADAEAEVLAEDPEPTHDA